MVQQKELTVTRRTLGSNEIKKLRRSGQIPGNIYGHKEASIPIQFESNAFDKLNREHGGRGVVALKGLQARTETVLVRHVQHDPVSDKILHVDFTRVSMDESIEAKIPLHFVGNAPGVKIVGGVLLHLIEALSVKCRADEIVEVLDVDISSLTDIDSILYARDVKLPENYVLAIDPEEPIAKIAAPKGEKAVEEVAAVPTPASETPAPAPEK